MKYSVLVLSLVVSICIGDGCWNPVAAEDAPRVRSRAMPELALWYEFAVVDGQRMPDISGKHHDGKLENGSVGFGRRKMAMTFDGEGAITLAPIPPTLDPTGRPFMVGAWCKPSGRNGVLAAMGGSSDGFSLYMQDGVPQFAVRVQGELRRVSAPEPVPVGQWVHLIGGIDDKGRLLLVLNGWPVAKTNGNLMTRLPSESFGVGQDEGSAVGNYETPMRLSFLAQGLHGSTYAR